MNISQELIGLPGIRLFDPLSKALGAISDGIVEYSYIDCVKLTGHSCPTVSSTFLATKLALETLFPDMMPIRGKIKVYFPADKSEGVTGVMANVVSLITGASDDGGFKGVAGKFSRNNRLLFKQKEIRGDIAFERIDSDIKVEIKIDLSTLESPLRIPELMKKVMAETANEQEREMFGNLWQQRVRGLFDSAEKYISVIS